MQFKLFVALDMAAPSFEDGHLAKRTCGTLIGEKLNICQEACKALCSAGTAGIASGLCEKACDLGPLKREAAPEPEPSFGQKACDVACDVACNSTVLALEQRKCLEKCVSVIHQCSFPGFHSADRIPCYRRPSVTTRFRENVNVGGNDQKCRYSGDAAYSNRTVHVDLIYTQSRSMMSLGHIHWIAVKL
ncbi:hypothetical protein BDV33DRAFT_189107 [Aspergillus novoparasiticus]|uniref:Uncharacterized protein n=1 Tax=Aspergillus novoparasiticus TaxID=986946 RepID=A0A5N6F1W6_9EURO|nr:hypothetical protein BDV33DRAFT_189107 [Aspergillus novoparasiticus]